MIRGTARFDGLAVGELTVNFLLPTAKVSAKAAFIDSQSGHTHGWTTNEQWSEETMQKLRELRAQMENDLAKIHFGEGTRVDGGQVPSQGLGEFLVEREGGSI